MKKIPAVLVAIVSLYPLVAQSVGDHTTAGFGNSRTYWNVGLRHLGPPLALTDTIELENVSDARNLLVFRDNLLVGQAGDQTGFSLLDADTGTRHWFVPMAGTGTALDYVPSFSGGTVLVGAPGAGVRAVNVEDGSVLWEENEVGEVAGRFPIATNNLVVFHGADRVVAADPETGEVLWQIETGTAQTPLILLENRIYLIDAQRNLRALDLLGNQIWSASGIAGAGASLLAVESSVFVADPDDGSIAAYDAATGAPVWGRNLSGASGKPGLAWANGLLFVFRADNGSGQAQITAIYPDLGDQKWQVTEEGAGLTHAFLANGILYYFNNETGRIRARDAETGTLVWSIRQPATRDLSGARKSLYVLLDDRVEVYKQSDEIYFAHLANGLGQSTMLTLNNPTDTPATATVSFFDSSGNPLTLETLDHGAVSEVEVDIPPHSSSAVETTGGEELISGWARARADVELRGSSIFRFSEPGGDLVHEAGVGDAQPTGFAAVFVVLVRTLDGQEQNTGVALANPLDETARVRLGLLDEQGAELASEELELESGAHLARYVTELFSEQLGDSFRGSLVLQADIPIVVTALRTMDGIQTSSYPVGQLVR